LTFRSAEKHGGSTGFDERARGGLFKKRLFVYEGRPARKSGDPFKRLRHSARKISHWWHHSSCGGLSSPSALLSVSPSLTPTLFSFSRACSFSLPRSPSLSLSLSFAGSGPVRTLCAYLSLPLSLSHSAAPRGTLAHSSSTPVDSTTIQSRSTRHAVSFAEYDARASSRSLPSSLSPFLFLSFFLLFFPRVSV